MPNATFTTDLTEAIAAEFPPTEWVALAMNDAGRRLTYPGRAFHWMALASRGRVGEMPTYASRGYLLFRGGSMTCARTPG